MDTCPKRAGVIPYVIHNSMIYFLFGIDRKTRELTDFGGGVKLNETCEIAAHRELHEESCNIFIHQIDVDLIKSSCAIFSKSGNTALYFVKLDEAWYESHIEEKFYYIQQALNEKKYNELVGVKWVSEINFREVVYNKYNHCLWKRIQNFLINNTMWSHLRMKLLFDKKHIIHFPRKENSKIEPIKYQTWIELFNEKI